MNGHIRRLTEHLFIKQVMNPAANVTDAVYPSTYIDVSGFARFAFLISVGATDDTAVTAQVVQATAAAGTGSKNITGAALTGTLLAGTNDNKWSVIEVDPDHMDIGGNFQFVALNVAATGGTATIAEVFFIGIEPHVKPPTFGADMAEIVYVDG